MIEADEAQLLCYLALGDDTEGGRHWGLQGGTVWEEMQKKMQLNVAAQPTKILPNCSLNEEEFKASHPWRGIQGC